MSAREELRVASEATVTIVYPPEAKLYLEWKSDGTVWCLWPDGRFIEVVPKEAT